ncbi:MAG: tetratricopeptide repeat protein, partial [Wujia sp.]
MSAGLSMASVNKIKELANSREYSLALELVEHQDLTKSLNPQFLRLCGEIYIQNGRYEDARRCLIMAHRLGPESKRILFTFVELYLRMGFFELAKTYYDMYMFDAGAFSSDTKLMQYIWKKHEGASGEVLEELLASYAHNLDYDWSFELYFLYKKQDKKTEAKTLAELYYASYKDSENSRRIQDVEAGNISLDTLFNVYAHEEVPDDKAEFEQLREEERALLETDYARMHPKEAEITVMYEDSYTPASSEKMVKRLLKKQDKEQERKDKKELKKQKKLLAATEETPETADVAEASEVSEGEQDEQTDSNVEDFPEKKGFFQKIFKRKEEK